MSRESFYISIPPQRLGNLDLGIGQDYATLLGIIGETPMIGDYACVEFHTGDSLEMDAVHGVDVTNNGTVSYLQLPEDWLTDLRIVVKTADRKEMLAAIFKKFKVTPLEFKAACGFDLEYKTPDSYQPRISNTMKGTLDGPGKRHISNSKDRMGVKESHHQEGSGEATQNISRR